MRPLWARWNYEQSNHQRWGDLRLIKIKEIAEERPAPAWPVMVIVIVLAFHRAPVAP
jgi:hypothetical protein